MDLPTVKPPNRPPDPPSIDDEKWWGDNYRLPKVISCAICHNPSKRVVKLPLPYNHDSIKFVMEKHGFINIAEDSKDYRYGFILETNMFGDRMIAAECARENGQLKEDADTSKGLYFEHLK